jgi:hypothetical protein
MNKLSFALLLLLQFSIYAEDLSQFQTAIKAIEQGDLLECSRII